MRILKKNYPNEALLMGAGLMMLAMVAPIISEPITNVVTSVRNTISGFLKKKTVMTTQSNGKTEKVVIIDDFTQPENYGSVNRDDYANAK